MLPKHILVPTDLSEPAVRAGVAGAYERAHGGHHG
jgi:hypothetical protein